MSHEINTIYSVCFIENTCLCMYVQNLSRHPIVICETIFLTKKIFEENQSQLFTKVRIKMNHQSVERSKIETKVLFRFSAIVTNLVFTFDSVFVLLIQSYSIGRSILLFKLLIELILYVKSISICSARVRYMKDTSGGYPIIIIHIS